MSTATKPECDFIAIVKPVDNWTTGHVYSRTELFGNAKWFNHSIMLSIKPGESWESAYMRQRGCSPEPRMQCFFIDR